MRSSNRCRCDRRRRFDPTGRHHCPATSGSERTGKGGISGRSFMTDWIKSTHDMLGNYHMNNGRKSKKPTTHRALLFNLTWLAILATAALTLPALPAEASSLVAGIASARPDRRQRARTWYRSIRDARRQRRSGSRFNPRPGAQKRLPRWPGISESRQDPAGFTGDRS